MAESMLTQMGKAAKEASYMLSTCSHQQKNALLLAIATAVDAQKEQILQANELDLQQAKKSGMSSGMLDRLALTHARIAGLVNDIRYVSTLPDPVGNIIEGRTLDNGMSLLKRRVPLGVIAAIYEARPNVTLDIASLCLKTGNATILRGGKETATTNGILVEIIQNTLQQHNFPAASVQAITDPDRALVTELLKLDAYVDMLIPRGGLALQKLCQQEATIPVILGGIGVCHIFVDETAHHDKSLVVIENAKTQRTSTCNTVETLLIHAGIANEFIPKLAQHLSPLGVKFHATPAAMPYFINASLPAVAVTDDELRNEWLSLDVNVHVVNTLHEAVSHIRTYGSAHSDAILTETMANAEQFIANVDSAAVFVNASTRFTDGGQFGLGAEVAVSTQKLHARGPLGLEALTTYKWIAQGNYTTRA